MPHQIWRGIVHPCQLHQNGVLKIKCVGALSSRQNGESHQNWRALLCDTVHPCQLHQNGVLKIACVGALSSQKNGASHQNWRALELLLDIICLLSLCPF